MVTPLEQGRHTFEVDGLTLAYEVRGQGPVCLVHSGGPGVRSSYLRMPEVERFATAVYLDPVGTGLSSRLVDGEYSVERYAQFAHQLIEGRLGGQVYFLGHSHGGFVGLQLALDHPDDLLGVILYDSAPVWAPEAFAEATTRMSAFVARFPGDETAIDAEAAWLSDDSPGDADSKLRRLRRMLPAYFADFRDGTVDVGKVSEGVMIDYDPNRQPSQWDVRERLGQIAVPMLVLAGRYDWICGHAGRPRSGRRSSRRRSRPSTGAGTLLTSRNRSSLLIPYAASRPEEGEARPRSASGHCHASS